MLEQSRRERHGNVRDAIRGAVSKQPAKDSAPSETVEQVEGSSTRRAFASRRSLIVILVVVVVIGGVVLHFGHHGSSSPALAANCTTPAAAVGDENSSLRYSITGPAQGTYVVTIDAATAVVNGNGVDLTPTSATAIAIKNGLKGCQGDGALPSGEGPGHQLVIFRDGRLVARATIPA
jgi:hypothetical protein